MGIKLLSIITLMLFITLGNAQKQTTIDLKTPLIEKHELSAAKTGTYFFIARSQTLAVREVGEDFSVWLKNYSSRQDRNTVRVTLTVELRSPTMIRKGRLIDRKEIEISFSRNKEFAKNEKFINELKRYTGKVGTEYIREAFYVGQNIENEIEEMIKQYK